MEQNYKNCQSCGMPMKKSPGGGGTNADGTISKKFCSYCFKDGQFINANWTVNQMQEFVKAKMKEMGFPGFLAGFFTKNIPKLERWNKV